MKLRNLFAIQYPLFYPEDGAGGGAAGDSPNGGTPTQTTQSAGTTGQPTAAPAGGANDTRTGAPNTGAFTYTEDRSKWIPPHRFNEVNTQAGKAKQLEQELNTVRTQLQAVTGALPADASAQKQQQVVDAFFALPGMGRFKKFLDMDEQSFDALLETPNHVQSAQQAEERAWQRHSDEQIGYIAGGIAEALNLDTLDAEAADELRGTFAQWLRKRAANEMATTGKSDAINRYEKGDKKLLDEFVTQHTTRWVDPARRTATARSVSRNRPVVNSGGRTAPTSVDRPATFKTMEERLDYAAKVARNAGAFRS